MTGPRGGGRTNGWSLTDLADQSGRTVIVTGANSGLGLSTARELAGAGAHVVLAVRNLDKGRAAAETIRGSTELRRVDLADLASVRAFAADWSGPIDVLVNNAGVMMVPRATTADGFEMQIGTNHLGHFALTNLLLPHIRDRVVTVGSLAHVWGRIDFDDLHWQRRRYSPVGAYGQAKLANMLFATYLQDLLDTVDSPLRSVAAHPGYTATGLGVHFDNRAAAALLAVGDKVLGQPPELGALPSVYAATGPMPPDGYVGPRGPGELRGAPRLVGRTRRARDRAVAARLWEVSAAATGTDFPLTAPAAEAVAAADAEAEASV